MDTKALAERYRDINARINAACNAASRPRAEVELIVVSKFHPAELVFELVRLGQHAFGENKDQEARPKAAAVAQLCAANGLTSPEWHFVGQLQSNKAKSVLGYAKAIHSLDRQSLLDALAKEKAREPKPAATDVFIELNLTDDPARGGIQPASLLGFAERVLAVEGLNLVGVMGVASLEGEEERDFAAIASASQELRTLASRAKYISAGMSQDFEIAVAYGATHLRIGAAITGPRQYLA